MPKITKNSIIRQRRQENLKPTPTALGIRVISRRLLCGESERPPPQVPITPLSLVENPPLAVDPVTPAPVQFPDSLYTPSTSTSNFNTDGPDIFPIPPSYRHVNLMENSPLTVDIDVDPVTPAPVQFPNSLYTPSTSTSNLNTNSPDIFPIPPSYRHVNSEENLPFTVDRVTPAPVQFPVPLSTSIPINTTNLNKYGPYFPIPPSFRHVPESTEPRPETTNLQPHIATPTNIMASAYTDTTPVSDTPWWNPLRSPRHVQLEEMEASAEQLPLNPDEEMKSLIRMNFYLTRLLASLPNAMKILPPPSSGSNFKRDAETRAAFMFEIRPIMLDLCHCINVLHGIDMEWLKANF